MIEVSRESCVVIKYYKVRVVTYTTYDVFLIHNETTGEIKMTSDGMSGASYDECFDDVVRIFKEQMGLNDSKKTQEENLCCLVIANQNYANHKLLRVNEVPKGLLEIDLENQRWRNLENERWKNRTDWNKIGESGHNYVRLVFDCTNFEHIKRAIEVAENLLR